MHHPRMLCFFDMCQGCLLLTNLMRLAYNEDFVGSQVTICFHANAALGARQEHQKAHLTIPVPLVSSTTREAKDSTVSPAMHSALKSVSACKPFTQDHNEFPRSREADRPAHLALFVAGLCRLQMGNREGELPG